MGAALIFALSTPWLPPLVLAGAVVTVAWAVRRWAS